MNICGLNGGYNILPLCRGLFYYNMSVLYISSRKTTRIKFKVKIKQVQRENSKMLEMFLHIGCINHKEIVECFSLPVFPCYLFLL